MKYWKEATDKEYEESGNGGSRELDNRTNKKYIVKESGPVKDVVSDLLKGIETRKLLLTYFCKTCNVTEIFSELDNSHLSFWAEHLGHKVIEVE